MKLPPSGKTAKAFERLSEADYLRLREDLAREIKTEIRHSGRQHLFAMGLHALMMVFMAVILFVSSQRYHDFMLWAVGLCLLLFSLLEFLDIDYVQTGHGWLSFFQRRAREEEEDEGL